jgi:hypothetical protein
MMNFYLVLIGLGPSFLTYEMVNPAREQRRQLSQTLTAGKENLAVGRLGSTETKSVL